jgi:hypothetical protein
MLNNFGLDPVLDLAGRFLGDLLGLDSEDHSLGDLLGLDLGLGVDFGGDLNSFKGLPDTIVTLKAHQLFC